MSAAQYVMIHNRVTQSDESVMISSLGKPTPNKMMMLKWQNMLDFVANLFGVSTSKITKVDQDSIDVVLTSTRSDRNVKNMALGSGSMDETVIGEGGILSVENRVTDTRWQMEEETPVAYLGVPIRWPDEEIFGTLSIEDGKEHVFSDRYHKIMDSFRKMVNMDLELLMQSDTYNRRSTYTTPSVMPIKTGICIYDENGIVLSWNKSAEEMLSYTSEDIVGKPITFVFPIINDIEERKVHNVMASNHQMKGLYIEKSDMMGGEGTILHVVSFSDYSDYVGQSMTGIGELHRDEQSGLYDHHSIVDLLNQEAKRTLRYEEQLSIVAVRIEGYKFIDSIHGEGSTDLIVQTVAIILKNETRDVDSIGRLTEDLFVIGLPSTGIKAAAQVATRIERVVARYSDEETPFTVATGSMALLEPVQDWHECILELLQSK